MKKEKWYYLIIFLVLLTIMIFLYDMFNKNYIKCNANLVSTICQIVISIAFSIVSLLGIVISLQNEKIYGISRREFNKFRISFSQPIMIITILSLVLSSISILLYIFCQYVLCLCFLTLLVFTCFFSCISEIPILCYNEKKLQNIIKKKLCKEINSKNEFSQSLKAVLKYLITKEKNLVETYNFTKNKNEEYNKKLLIKLLELQHDRAFELLKLDQNSREEIADVLVNNIKDIINFNNDFDVIEITKGDILNYQHYITRTLFRTLEIKALKEKTLNLIIGKLPFINYIKNEKHKNFILSITVKMITSSLTNGNLDIVKELKKVCSEFEIQLNKDTALTTIFAIVSMHLYYLYNDGRLVSEEFKKQILEFIDKSSIINNYITKSWKQLYSRFISVYNLNFETFIQYFKYNVNGWDMNIYDSNLHSLVMDERYALVWFLSNLFSSYQVYEYNYEKLLKIKSISKRSIKNIGNEILKDNRRLTEMTKYVEFYNKGRNCSLFIASEENNSRFEKFIRSLFKEDIEELISLNENINKVEKAKEYKNKINEVIRGEYGYTSKINLDTVEDRIIIFTTDMFSYAINHDESLIDYLIDLIRIEIANSVKKKVIHYSKIAKSKLNNKSSKTLYITDSLKYYAEFILNECKINNKTKTEYFNSSILYGDYLIFKNQFKFGYDLSLSIYDLSPQQIAEKAEEYKMNDGRYIYEGALLSREEIESYISKQYGVFEIKLKCKVNNEEIKVYEIDLYK